MSMGDLPDIRGMIEDSVSRYVRERHSFEQRREIISAPAGFSAEHWRIYADLGWLALPMPLECGGLGGKSPDVHALMHQFGRAMVTGPYLSSVLVGAKLIELAAPEPSRTELLSRISSGKTLVSFAASEIHSGYDLNHVVTTATPAAEGFTLDGQKVAVPYANVADHLVVSARTAGRHDDRRGVSLFLLPSDAERMEAEHHRSHDGGRVSSIRFRGAKGRLIGTQDEAIDIIERVRNHACAAICAEMTGAMWALFEQTLDYLKTRSQFGAAIGSFQALQHRMVDMYMQCEMAYSLGLDAARAMDELDGERQDLVVSAAKWHVGESAIHVAEEAIQLHGAMGMMDELPIGHYLKRVSALNAQFGSAAHHQARYRQVRR